MIRWQSLRPLCLSAAGALFGLVLYVMTAVPVAYLFKLPNGKLPFMVEWTYKPLAYLDDHWQPAHMLFRWEYEFFIGKDER